MTTSPAITAFVLRATQALFDAAPTLLLGVVVAGILRGMAPAATVRRLFGRGAFQTSMLAMLLPLCSFGVLPVARELRRMGVPPAQLISFVIAAPLLNPISLMYGVTSLAIHILLLVVGLRMAIPVVVSAVASKWMIGSRPAPDAVPLSDLGRLATVGIGSARTMAGPVLKDLFIGLVGVGAAAAMFTPAWLRIQMDAGNFLAAPLMSAYALPLYLSPLEGIVQTSVMTATHYSIGAALCLYVFGVGLNLALVLWLAEVYGIRRLFTLALVLASIVFVVGYIADASFDHPGGKDSESLVLEEHGRLNLLNAADAYDVFRKRLSAPSISAAVALAALLAAGVALRVARIERWEPPPRTTDRVRALSRPIPARWLAGLVMLGVFGGLAALAYVYYPAPTEVLEDMRLVRTNTIASVSGRDSRHALREIDAWDGLAAKLPLSALLRGANPPEGSERVAQLRSGLRTVREAIVAGDFDVAKAAVRTAATLDAQCRQAYEAPNRPAESGGGR